jgi:hypothetical protein
VAHGLQAEFERRVELLAINVDHRLRRWARHDELALIKRHDGQLEVDARTELERRRARCGLQLKITHVAAIDRRQQCRAIDATFERDRARCADADSVVKRRYVRAVEPQVC